MKKEQQRKNKRLKEIIGLKECINKKDAGINSLKKNIKEIFYEKKKLIHEFIWAGKKVEILESEKEVLLKSYNKHLEKQSELGKEYERELSNLKYDSCN